MPSTETSEAAVAPFSLLPGYLRTQLCHGSYNTDYVGYFTRVSSIVMLGKEELGEVRTETHLFNTLMGLHWLRN